MLLSSLRLSSRRVMPGLGLVFAALLALLVPSTQAANFTVSNGADSGPGTLRQAIFDANVNADPTNTITLVTNVTLTRSLPMITKSVTIVGGGFTVDANNTGRAFFIQGGTVSIANLTIANARAQGGAGGAANQFAGGGGGGLGAGAAVFVYTGADARLENVTVEDAVAIGGTGGDGAGIVSGYITGGGGGGLGGSGGAARANRTGGGGGGYAGNGGDNRNGGGGGGGEFGAGGTGFGGGGGGGGQQGTGGDASFDGTDGGGGGGGGAILNGAQGTFPLGGAGGGSEGGAGGDRGTAGSAAANPLGGGGGGGAGGGNGGNGAFSGGGGGGGRPGTGGSGGTGGGGGGGFVGGPGGDFGGGGGAAERFLGGAGGFGGGGGGTGGYIGFSGTGGAGGFGAGGGGGGTAGSGGTYGGTGGAGEGVDGGGGAALGGAVFVADGGALTLANARFTGTYSVTAGTTLGAGGATAGQALGGLMFLHGTATTTIEVGVGRLENIGQAGGSLAGEAGSALVKTGPGTLVLNGDNTFPGTLEVNAGVLQIAGAHTGDITVGATSMLVVMSGGTVAGTVTVLPGGSLINRGTITTVAGVAAINIYNEAQLRAALFYAGNGSTVTFASDITLTQSLPMIGVDLTIVGAGRTLDADNTGRAFFVRAGMVSIANLTIANARAQGGTGGAGNTLGGGGGGGLGAGAAVFVYTGADVVLENVSVGDAAAIGGLGGNGAGALHGYMTGGGGGGLGGHGGDARGNNAGGGGGGYSGNGGDNLGLAGGGGGGEFGVGGDASNSSFGGGGGGGQQSAGGSSSSNNAGGGGGGATLDGGDGVLLVGGVGGGLEGGAGGALGQPGSAAAAPLGGGGGGDGNGGPGTGGAGALSGGGGGGFGAGGAGGIGGGGGGGSVGGAGGDFGGGGGVAQFAGGAGGFGGGGGGTGNSVGGAGGFGAGGGGGGTAGGGGSYGGNGGAGAGADGGGGAALGGAVFVATGGTLTIRDTSFSGTYSVTPGQPAGTPGATTPATAGQAHGAVMFLHDTAATTIEVEDGATQTLAGADSLAGEAAASFTKTGTGTFQLTGNNSFAGAVTVAAGILRTTGDLTAGSLVTNGNGRFSIGGGGTSGSYTGDIVNNFIVSFDRTDTHTYGGAITGAGTVHHDGTGTLTLSGSSAPGDGLFVNAGTVLITGSMAANGDGAFIAAGARLRVGNGAGSGTLTGTVGGAGTLVFQRTNTLTYAQPISGTVSVVQEGSGIVDLTAVNTYTGSTTVSAGTLRVNGSLANTATTVASGATLGGAGTIGGGVTVASGGRIAPGSNVGTLTVGGLTWHAGAVMDYELGASGTGDRLAITGALAKAGTGAHVFDLNDTGAPGTYTLVTFDAQSDFAVGDFTASNVPVGLVPLFVLGPNSLQLTLATPGAVTGTMSVSGAFERGSGVSYTVTLSNAGTFPQANNPGDEFTFGLPGALTLTGATASSGSVVSNTGAATVTWNGGIPAGGFVTLTISATLDDDASGVVRAQGTIAFDADADGTHESTALTDDPGVGGAADATEFVVFEPEPVVATITIDGTDRVYDGSPKPVSVTTDPAGLATRVLYDGEPTAPSNAGSYEVTVEVEDEDYTGSATATLSIGQAGQTITFAAPAGVVPGESFLLQASASSGLSVAFELVSGNATLAGASLTLHDASPVVVRATQAGDANHLAADPVERTIAEIAKRGQTITFDPPSNLRWDSPPVTLVATASSGLPVTFTLVSGPGTISGSTLTLGDGHDPIVVRASQAGDATYEPAPGVERTLTITPRIVGRFINLSARARAGAGAHVFIAGFVIAGTAEEKQLLVRGVGPGLIPFGVAGTLPNPVLRIGRGLEMVAENDDWSGDPVVAETAVRLGAFPLDPSSADAAMVATLPSGPHFAIVGSAEASQAGVVLAEIYDAANDPGPHDRHFVNFSVRAEAGAGDNVIIAGFVVSGETPANILVRGVGPGLVPYGLSPVLADPRLYLFRGAEMLASNDDASEASRAAGSEVGAFALETGSKDAAFVVTVDPGAYTVMLTGGDATAGIALLEVYELP